MWKYNKINDQLHAVSCTPVSRGNLVLRHSVSHFLPNSGGSTPEWRYGNIHQNGDMVVGSIPTREDEIFT